jgi:hypothetical protein
MSYAVAGETWCRVKNWTVSTDVSSATGTDSFALPNGLATNDNFPLFQSEIELDTRKDTAQKFKNTSLARQDYSFTHGGFGISSGGSIYSQFIFSGDCGDIQISQDPTGATSSFTGTLNGSNVTLYVIDNGADSYNATFLDIIPVEWWPYASRADGSPIWDAATGALLQDPRN